MNQPLNILLLEDEPADAMLIQWFMEKNGFNHHYTIAGTRDEFIHQVKQQVYDVILADNSLPQFNSLDALAFLKEIRPDTPFILVTGAVSEEFAVEILQQGADDYILKGNLKKLPTAINRALEKKRIKIEKEKAEDEVRKSELRFRALIEHNADGIIIRDENFLITYCSPSAKRILGFAEDEPIALTLDDTFHPDDLYKLEPFKKLVMASPGIAIPITFRKKNKKGEFIWVEGVMTNMLHNESVKGIISNFRDVTEQKKAELELKEVNRELHNLSHHLQSIREEERIQIARDIHDELGQQLTGLKMDVSWLQKKIEKGEPGISGKISDMTKLIDEAVKSVRRICSNLRPSILDDLGLVAALEWQSLETEKRYGIKVHFHSTFSDLPLSIEKITGLFRIYQEALNNTLKHANAQTVSCNLFREDDKLIMEISDDGQGMSQEDIRDKKSFGLLGIKERVLLMEGNYEMFSEPGKGTRISISIPIGNLNTKKV